MDDGSGLGDDFDGGRSEPCCSGLTLASGVLDCESDEQQMATQEWRSDASALRPSVIYKNAGVIIMKMNGIRTVNERQRTANKQLMKWPMAASGASISPQQEMVYKTRLIEPPADFKNIRVTMKK